MTKHNKKSWTYHLSGIKKKIMFSDICVKNKIKIKNIVFKFTYFWANLFFYLFSVLFLTIPLFLLLFIVLIIIKKTLFFLLVGTQPS